MILRSRRYLLLVSLLTGLALLSAPAGADDPTRSVASVEFIGEATIPTGTLFDGTEVGGLSSITYAGGSTYHALSDDQGNRDTGDPVRFYTLNLDLSDGYLDDGDVTFTSWTQLFDLRRDPFAPGGLDPEGFALTTGSDFFVTSEGNTLVDPPIPPFVRRYDRRGVRVADLAVPGHYLPDAGQGIRFNLSFESANLTPDRRTLVTAGEGALIQDGPASTFDNGSLARILFFDQRSGTPISEYVYEVGPWAEPSAIFGVNGIVEVLPIDNAGTMLVMERSFSVGGTGGAGTGNVVAIYESSTIDADDVLDVPALYVGGDPIDVVAVNRRLVFAFDDLGIPIDNLEGMAFGPRLADGRHTLVIVSDNNFNPAQFTQFIVLALELRPD